jgi:antitoxin component YwqK of YwqJK toxin-antitoxin module
MEIFQEVKTSLIEQAKTHNVCGSELERAIDAQTWSELQNVICDNIGWCITNDIRLPDGYYKNSEIEFTITDGKLHGEYVEFHENGKVAIKCFYKNGKLHGEYISYYGNGNIYKKYDYKNDKVKKKFTYVHG